MTLTEKNDRFPPQSVRFMVNQLNQPLFDKQLNFTRPSYAPGDEVVLLGKIKLPSQQPWANGTMRGQILIDNEQYDLQGNKSNNDIAASTDAAGNVKLNFKLPTTISTGQGSLTLQFLTGQVKETWTHPIRIETGKILVDCYPESGDLIAGIPNTVYFQMRNLNGEAVDGTAELIDSQKKVVQTLSTFHDDTEAKASRGMGRFAFTPRLAETYSIRTTKPAHSQVVLNLPQAKPTGVGLHINQSILSPGAPLELSLHNVGQPRDLVITVYCRGILLALDQISLPASMAQSVLIDQLKPLDGVYRVTIAEILDQQGTKQLKPLAERLVYRHPSRVLKLDLKSERLPDREIQLHVQARTETNQPSPAYVTIVGINKSLLQLAEASTNRRLPAHFLIAQEVRQPEELEFADFFLSQHPAAPRALDLLLGVQGWRRFKETDTSAALQKLKTLPVQPLPIKFYDNRDEVMARIQQETKAKVMQSTEARQYQLASRSLGELQTQLLDLRQKKTQQQVELEQSIQQAEYNLARRQLDWQNFGIWFQFISAGTLGILSLVGLGALGLRRKLLPIHLVITLAGLSILGLVGAGLLYSWQQKSNLAQSKQDMKAVVHSASEQSDSNKDRETRLQNAPAKMQSQPDQKPGNVTRHLDFTKTDGRKEDDKIRADAMPSPAPAASKKELFSNQPQAITPQPPAVETAAPPKPAGDGLRLRGNMNNYAYQQQTELNRNKDNALALRSPEQQQRFSLADNRTTDIPANPPKKMGRDLDNLKEEKSGAIDNSKAKGELSPKSPPAPSPGGLGGMGGGARGGMAGAPAMPPGKGSPPPASLGAAASPPVSLLHKSGESQESLKQDRTLLRLNDEMQRTAFTLREYSWQENARPAGLSGTSDQWSKTVYWHPQQVIPATGKLSLPLSLPAAAGTYQFEVYGHDGQGRLGAATIEVRKEELPVSLSTRLTKAEARVGDLVQLDCQVTNLTTRRQPQVIAKIAIPDGLKLPNSMKQLRVAVKNSAGQESTEPASWHLQGRELTIKWAELASGQKAALRIDFICDKAGDQAAGNSQAYLENQERDAAQASGLKIRIRP